MQYVVVVTYKYKWNRYQTVNARKILPVDMQYAYLINKQLT